MTQPDTSDSFLEPSGESVTGTAGAGADPSEGMAELSQPGDSASPARAPEKTYGGGGEDDFDLYARGAQWWEWLRVRMVDGRIQIIIEADHTYEPIQLSRIQSEVLAGWLAAKVAIDI